MRDIQAAGVLSAFVFCFAPCDVILRGGRGREGRREETKLRNRGKNLHRKVLRHCDDIHRAERRKQKFVNIEG